MNWSAATLFGGRFMYLVTTKTLQQQLARDPFGLAEIRGHSDYLCARDSYRLGGSNRYESDFECRVPDESCGYKQDVLACIAATGNQTNYAHWIALAKSGNDDRLGAFDTLICDEAHLVTDVLVNQLAVPIVPSVLHRYLTIDQIPKHGVPIAEWLEFARYVVSRCEEEISAPNLPAKTVKVLTRIESEFLRAVDSMPHEPWVAKVDDGDNSTHTNLVPVHPSRFAERYLFRGIKNIILCSATLMPEIVSYLGIPAEHCSRVEMGSPFAANRRPVIFWRADPLIRVDRRMTRGMWQVIMRRADRIIADRHDRRGIFHSRSYDRVADFLRETKTPREQIVTHDRGRGALSAALDRYFATPPPQMIVSPSLQEGYDFANDKARYQIIPKVPFLDVNDPLTAARKKSHPDYVNACAGITLMQTVGRVCRNPSDYGESIILDGHWGQWFHRAVEWPRYFRDSFRVVDEAPEPLNF
jgi:hypothetical protein